MIFRRRGFKDCPRCGSPMMLKTIWQCSNEYCRKRKKSSTRSTQNDIRRYIQIIASSTEKRELTQSDIREIEFAKKKLRELRVIA